MSALPPLKLLFTATFVTFGCGFHYGYQTTVINPTISVFQAFVNESYTAHYGTQLTESKLRLLWASIASSFMFGGLIGTLGMPVVANRFGRKSGLYLSSALLIVSSCMGALSRWTNSFEQFAAARLISGVAVGFATGFQAIYLTELSPTRFRGFIGTYCGTITGLGLLSSSILGNPAILGSETRWPILYWIEIFPVILLLLFAPFWHESPNFLLAQGLASRAKCSITSFHGNRADIQKVLLAIQDEMQVQKKSVGYHQLWNSLGRRGMVLGTLINICSQFSGGIAINTFAVFLLSEIGFTEQKAAYAFGLYVGLGCIWNFLSTFGVERLGRRPILLFNLAGCAICNCLFLFLVTFHKYYPVPLIGYLFYGTMLIYSCTLCFGLGPAAWFITTEMVPHNARASAQSLAIMAKYISGFLIPIIFFPLQGKFGGLSFLLFIVPLTLACIYCYMYLPETKNKTICQVLREMYDEDEISTLGGTEEDSENMI